MEHRPLGESGIEVSALSLGSWRTFERVPRETGVAVLTAARDAGIDFLDDARYDDETGALRFRPGTRRSCSASSSGQLLGIEARS